jgi:predicted nucleic-acid-binding protein
MMPALDTNLLVRFLDAVSMIARTVSFPPPAGARESEWRRPYFQNSFLVRDDPAQLETVRRMVNEAAAPLFVPIPIILELEWVLRSRHWVCKTRTMGSLVRLVGHQRLHLRVRASAQRGFAAFRGRDAGFAGCLHLALAAQAAALPLLTFDEDAGRLPGAALALQV